MLAVARATAVLCALIGTLWNARSGAPEYFTSSEVSGPWHSRKSSAARPTHRAAPTWATELTWTTSGRPAASACCSAMRAAGWCPPMPGWRAFWPGPSWRWCPNPARPRPRCTRRCSRRRGPRSPRCNCRPWLTRTCAPTTGCFSAFATACCRPARWKPATWRCSAGASPTRRRCSSTCWPRPSCATCWTAAARRWWRAPANCCSAPSASAPKAVRCWPATVRCWTC